MEDLIEEEESESNQDDKRPRRNIIKPTKFQKEAVEPIKPAAPSTKKVKSPTYFNFKSDFSIQNFKKLQEMFQRP